MLLLDIDECVTNDDDCHADAACINTKGAWECFCNQGYAGNGTHCIGTFFICIHKELYRFHQRYT